MWGIESIAPQAGEQHLALKHCRQEVRLGTAFLLVALGHECAEKLRHQSPKISFIDLLSSAASRSSQHLGPRYLQLKPEGKTRPVPLHPAARGEALPKRRGFVLGEAPGFVAAGNSPQEGEATLICNPRGTVQPHRQGLATLSGPWGRGTAKGLSPGTRQPAVRIALPLSGLC